MRPLKSSSVKVWLEEDGVNLQSFALVSTPAVMDIVTDFQRLRVLISLRVPIDYAYTLAYASPSLTRTFPLALPLANHIL
ncbi:hypothetical protein K443DRAFT_15135 [Laccaria amethystina LaAM-08-1]|uniref:Uncharacterized protein n=1 Tax=Laccaria amethystina LaAM-08-1 TaxID=1095629 RepID=A0A0C9WLS1_9AGAR|nr:hypothetical protein K443DRAFT_15135 [Laccaria amethystina LaAM-08-1]